MKANIEPLVPDCYYQIYNRGINGEILFKKEAHYSLFLNKYAYHVSPFVDTFAYCLMSNHFHLLVRIKSYEDIVKEAEQKYRGKRSLRLKKFLSSQFAHLYNGYAQKINTENRTGSLLESPFRRIEGFDY